MKLQQSTVRHAWSHPAQMRWPVPRHGQSGFTLIELLIVLTIGGVLAVIAVPSMRDMLNSTRQSSALSLLISDLNQARGEAIKRNASVAVCGRNATGTNCGAVTDWRVGWVVCTDAVTTVTNLPPSDNQCDASTPDNPNPIVVRPPLDAALTLAVSVAVVRFSPNSAVATAADFAVGGVWADAVPRKVCILRTGNMLRLPPSPVLPNCPT